MTLAATLNGRDYVDFVERFGLDLAAVLVLSAGLYVRRHRRRDLFLVFTTFNIGIFSVLTVITEHRISAAVGFGLFGLLSIIRLRSEPFANVELGYFFASLVLGVVNGIGHGDRTFNALIDVVVVGAVFALDHPRLQHAVERRRIVLDRVHTDVGALRGELERRFAVEIVELHISDVDYVRETTTASIRFVDRHGRAASGQFTLEQAGLSD